MNFIFSQPKVEESLEERYHRLNLELAETKKAMQAARADMSNTIKRYNIILSADNPTPTPVPVPVPVPVLAPVPAAPSSGVIPVADYAAKMWHGAVVRIDDNTYYCMLHNTRSNIPAGWKLRHTQSGFFLTPKELHMCNRDKRVLASWMQSVGAVFTGRVIERFNLRGGEARPDYVDRPRRNQAPSLAEYINNVSGNQALTVNTKPINSDETNN